MRIPDGDFVSEVCGLGRQAGACSFLSLNRDGFQCAKGDWTERLIRIRLRDGEHGALADNCSGAPNFTPTRPEDRQ